MLKRIVVICAVTVYGCTANGAFANGPEFTSRPAVQYVDVSPETVAANVANARLRLERARDTFLRLAQDLESPAAQHALARSNYRNAADGYERQVLLAAACSAVQICRALPPMKPGYGD